MLALRGERVLKDMFLLLGRVVGGPCWKGGSGSFFLLFLMFYLYLIPSFLSTPFCGFPISYVSRSLYISFLFSSFFF